MSDDQLSLGAAEQIDRAEWDRHRALDKVRAETWAIAATHPGATWDEDESPVQTERCFPTVEDRTIDAYTDAARSVMRGACLGCAWKGEEVDGFMKENAAVEDAHDHAWPGWRDLPALDRSVGESRNAAMMGSRKQQEAWGERWRKRLLDDGYYVVVEWVTPRSTHDRTDADLERLRGAPIQRGWLWSGLRRLRRLGGGPGSLDRLGPSLASCPLRGLRGRRRPPRDGGRRGGAVRVYRRKDGSFTVRSASGKAGGYHVRRHPDGAVSCTCPAWRFQSEAPVRRTCKHTVAAVGTIEEAV